MSRACSRQTCKYAKTISSRKIRKAFGQDLKKLYWKPVLWSRSCGIVSATGAALLAVKQYIENHNSG
ncbi:MAG: hypothetical protein GY874_03025 [Desulfobacteraceae bacterium]|nr:hypothetical protein [Desulfobacteraceae bacterium]